MPFVPTSIIGAVTAIQNTIRNQKNAQETSEREPAPQQEPNAFMQLFFNSGK